MRYLLVLLFLFGCGQSTSVPLEAWNDYNRPSLFQMRTLDLAELTDEKSLSGELDMVPWSDTYWPLQKKGLADRWLGGPKPESFEIQKKAALKSVSAGVVETYRLSPAEKYDLLIENSEFLVTKKAWSQFEYYDNEYTGAWGWMGLCHGWASASYMESAPLHAVIAKGPLGDVLFTQGDVRGLLTKLYAEMPTDRGSLFMGERCNNEMVKKDDYGRVVDGFIHREGQEDQQIFITQNRWSTNIRYISDKKLAYTDDLGGLNQKVIQAIKPLEEPKGAYLVKVFESFDDFYRGNYTEATFTYLRGCRDLNAASFHIGLVDYLSDSADVKKGFVVEVSRGYQVWNQPAYGFESEITVEEFDAENDELAIFRAPGTRKIATVKTRLQYGIENGPFVKYEKADDLLNTRDYEYTLEIDANDQVIGGEWDLNSGAIDFVWADQGKPVKPRQNQNDIIDVDLVKKIHNCSLTEEGVRNLEIDGELLRVSDCHL